MKTIRTAAWMAIAASLLGLAALVMGGCAPQPTPDELEPICFPIGNAMCIYRSGVGPQCRVTLADEYMTHVTVDDLVNDGDWVCTRDGRTWKAGK